MWEYMWKGIDRLHAHGRPPDAIKCPEKERLPLFLFFDNSGLTVLAIVIINVLANF